MSPCSELVAHCICYDRTWQRMNNVIKGYVQNPATCYSSSVHIKNNKKKKIHITARPLLVWPLMKSKHGWPWHSIKHIYPFTISLLSYIPYMHFPSLPMLQVGGLKKKFHGFYFLFLLCSVNALHYQSKIS